MKPTKEEQTGSDRKSGRGIGIRGKLFLVLLAFTLLVLFLIWLFQIELLNPIYESIKQKELVQTSDAIAYCISDGEDLQTAVYNVASEYNICVTVYRLDGSYAREMARVHVSGSCASHQMTEEERASLYDKAVENGGSFSKKVVIKRQTFEFGRKNNSETEGNRSVEFIVAETVNMVLMRLASDDAGNTYLILLDAKLSPLASTVNTLQLQFGWLVLILLVLALLISFGISRLISRPIVSMNQSAKRLAAGDYGAEFRGSGFRESRELADTLNYAATELSQTDRLQKELIANISHDLRTPLTMIKGYGEVMRDIPGENTPENVQAIIDEAERMSQLVNDLLDLSRIEVGVRKPVPEYFNLTETVRDTMLRYDKLIHHDGYQIVFESDCEVTVYADRTMILQAVYNLINNAVNYTGSDRSVTVRQTVQNGKVRLSVADSGSGIPKEELPMIWDRYYRVDKVHRRATVGTGLGLSIVKGILTSHDAAYGVESTVGKGSVFWFELPIATQPLSSISG